MNNNEKYRQEAAYCRLLLRKARAMIADHQDRHGGRPTANHVEWMARRRRALKLACGAGLMAKRSN